MERKRFTDKVVLVTGSTSGLGREIAIAFAKEEYRVFGWTTPKGLDMYIRMILIEMEHKEHH